MSPASRLQVKDGDDDDGDGDDVDGGDDDDDVGDDDDDGIRL